MGIFNRIINVIKSNINDLIDKAEDPEKMLRQLILDMQEQYSEAKVQVAQAIADEKKLEREYEEQLKLQEEWSKKAEIAVSKQNDELALKALKRKNEHQELAKEYKVNLDKQKQVTKELKDSLQELNDKIEEAKRKKDLLIAKSKRIKARETINKTYTEIKDTSTFDNFKRMEEKIACMEDKVNAYEELNKEIVEDKLDKEFEQLEKSRENLELMSELNELKDKISR